MILQSLHLKGAKGIKYGIGLDEIFLDFSKFQPGLVAIVGRNGFGKTTLLENLTPFRTLFSRKGKLQLHFTGADAHRILKFKIDQDEYSAEIYIDAEKDDAEAILTKNGLSIATKSREYDRAINGLFLDKDLFEQSLFFGQDTRRISDLRAGDAKDFMAKLLRLDFIQALQKRSSVHLNDIIHEHEAKQLHIRGLEERIIFEDSYLASLKIEEARILDSNTQLQEIRSLLTKLEEQLSKEAVVIKLREEKIRIDSSIRELSEKLASRRLKNSQIISTNDKRALIEKKEHFEAFLQEVSIDVKDFENLGVLQERRLSLTQKISDLKNKYSIAEADKAKVISQTSDKISLVKTRTASLSTTQERAKKTLTISKDIPCGERFQSDCPLLSDARDATQILIDTSKKLNDISVELEHLQKVLQDEIAPIDVRIERIKGLLSPLEAELEILDIEYARVQALEECYHKYQNALKGIEVVKHKLDICDELLHKEEEDFASYQEDASATIVTLEKQKVSVEARIGQITDSVNFDTLRESRNDCIENIDIIQKDIERSTLKKGQLQGQLQDITLIKADIRKATKVAQSSLHSLGEWQVIEKAFGKAGIQAFEIKRALPAIVKTMNELLIGDLGQKFSLNFRMKRQGTQGQLIDTFDPLITRYSENEIVEKDVPLQSLSRGERILIFVAMSEAVGIYLRNAIGMCLQTAFVDEADGPLDPANRIDYLKTRIHVHEMCGLHHTFIISQSPEIYDAIPQKLLLEKGNITIIT